MHENQIYTNVSYMGNKIHVRGVNIQTGKRFSEAIPYQPRFFVHSEDSKIRTSESFTDMFGNAVGFIEFDSPKSAKNFLTEYENVEDVQIFGQKNFAFDYISRFLWEKSAHNWKSEYLSVGSLDIEVECEDGFSDPEAARERVNVITVYVSSKKRFATFTLGQAENPDPANVDIFCYDTEADMLQDFLRFWGVCKFDIVTGWNQKFFDVPYLYNRMVKLLGEEEATKLSPHGWIKEKKTFFRGKEQLAYEISGMALLDYLELYLKYAFTPLESYKLDTVAKHEGIEGKIPWEEKYASIKEFYQTDFNEFVEYNIQDVQIIVDLEHKLRFIELHCGIAYMAGVNFEDAMSPIRTWEAFIYNKFFEKGIICPVKNIKSVVSETFEGAYVMDPEEGLYEWIASFDVTSLYPSIINALNISPETFDYEHHVSFNIDEFVKTGKVAEKYDGITLSANGYFHDKKHGSGILPQLIQEVFASRVQARKELAEVKNQLETDKSNVGLQEKKAQLHSRQMALKILLNSLYGAISNKYFIFYNLKQAEAVTLTGQAIIRRMSEQLNSHLRKTSGQKDDIFVIYNDTDSVYLSLGSIVNKTIPNASKEDKIDFMSRLCKEFIEPYIDKQFKDMETEFGWMPNFLHMNREIIAERAIWTGKKRYVCLVNDTEGIRHATPKIKVTGIEVVRSSTPEICRNKLRESLKLVLGENESDVHQFINEFRKEFMRASPKDIAFPRSANGLTKYAGDAERIYGFKTPICTKGALLYNHFLRQKKLNKKYPLIMEGEKVKFIYLREPNPLRDKVIAFPSYIPQEMGIEEYIDYSLMFEKSFIEPIGRLLHARGWSTEKRNTLESMFQ